MTSSVTSIGWEAFSHCSALSDVTFGNGTTLISTYAFEYCQSLSNITIPDSVVQIANRAFRYCDGLTSVSIPNSVISIGFEAFLDTPNCTFYVPTRTISSLLYKSDSNIQPEQI